MVTETTSKPKPAFFPASGGARCWNCGKMVAWLVTAPYKLQCQHCKSVNEDMTNIT